MPAQIGPYQVDREIGRGGMGVVYLARDSRLDREVAIKCLPDEFGGDEERLERFNREARLLASLNHPNIATVHGLEEVDGKKYLVLEYIDGESLADCLRQPGRSWRKSLEVASGIADALAAAHARGVAHRDVKPDNVRFTRDGRVKVLDFGLACTVQKDGSGGTDATTVARDTRPGAVMGTPGYMAPEQARGQPADARSDIFAFGCLLYEMLTGRVAFGRDTIADSLAATLQEDVEPPSRITARIPAELDAIVMRCLEKRPDDRFQSARDLAFALRGISDRSTSVAGSERMPAGRPYLPRLVAGSLAIGCLVVVIAWYVTIRSPDDRITSLAVLPFVNESEDPQVAFLCEGVAESIINRMGGVDQLRVVSRNTSFRHAGREDELEQVARDLGVDAIVTGRVIRRGERLIIGVSVDDAKGELIWGDRFDRSLADILVMEGDIVDRIATGMSLQLTAAQRSQLAMSPTPNPDAYLAYLKGSFWHLRIEGEAYRRALQHYDRALELDSDFALAHAAKAHLYCNRGLGLFSPAREVWPQARAGAELAVSLDAELPQAHLAIGFIRYIWEWDFAGAETALREALRLKPDFGFAYHILAHVLATQGRFAEALALSKDATRLEPHTLIFNSCQGHFYAWNAQPELAMAKLRETNAADSGFGHTYVYLGRELVAQGLPDEGIEVLEHLRDSGLRVQDAGGDLGWAYAEAGRRDDAIAELAALEERAAVEFIPNIAFARIHAGLRDDDQTIEWLQRAVEAREAVLPLIRNEPHFRHLHDDPRFVAILDRIGLPH
jgi:serine/threonine-protein kinase